MSTPIMDPKAKRTSTACEACRNRRTRCRGGIPCLSCVAHDQSHKCYVRQKSRPNRPISQRKAKHSSSVNTSYAPTSHLPQSSSSGPSLETDAWPASPSTNPIIYDTHTFGGPSTGSGRSCFGPVAQIEERYNEWCLSNGSSSCQPRSHPRAYDSPRLSQAPLPPLDAQSEDELMSSFTSSPTINDLDFLDPSRLNDLYRRYKLVPLSVGDDTAALLNACFCIASFTRMATIVGQDGHPNIQFPLLSKRTDLSYYQKSCGLLQSAGRSSIDGLWALQLLTSYAIALGTAPEVGALLDSISTQVHELGLHRQETAALYPADDRAQKLFYSCFFLDTWYSTITDSLPRLPWGSFDHQLASASDLPRAAVDITICESELLQHLHDDNIDSTSPEFVLGSESKWLKHMSEWRLSSAYASAGAKTIVLWASIRFYWLWILLRYPCLSHPLLGASSLPIVMASIGHILSIYTILDESSSLNPSWPQLRRIITCGQLLIVCQDQGAIPLADFLRLAELTFALLERHAETWPVAGEVLASLKLSVTDIGTLQSPRPPLPLEDGSQPPWPSESGGGAMSHGFGISLEAFLTDWQERPWDGLWSAGSDAAFVP